MSIDGSAYLMNNDFWSRQRVRVGYTVPALADKVSVCPQTLSNWFSGRAIPRDRADIYRLCRCLDVDYIEGLRQFELAPNYIEDLCAMHNMSVRDLAELIDTKTQTVYHWIQHVKPIPTAKLNDIAAALDMDSSEFFRGYRAELHPAESAQPEPVLNVLEVANPIDNIVTSEPNTDSRQFISDKSTSDHPKKIFNALYGKISLRELLELVELAGTYTEFDISVYLDNVYAGMILDTRQSYEIVTSVLNTLSPEIT